ncbi:MAG: C40 family peptidase [Saprospiraceae bacterium]|nr:C40 family peptidase [Saprospiraceae bacterium]MCF8249350.1 C40 family peptidase [Saprospiraceae bacterium]MCF8311373.1 C40 family peptidase [Saprospiraceae bacterium]MCF8439969.1 C40 family peptidase [Saprospiraceae bacterium]
MCRFVLLFVLIGWLGCQQNYQLKQAQQIIEEVHLEFAPDKRVALFRIDTIIGGKMLEFHGETNLPEAKKTLFEKLTIAGITFVDSLALLPSLDLNGKHFGIVNVSVCNFRSEPKHSAELATQSLLGTTLRVWKKQGDFYLVQSPDNYFGWLDDGGLQLMTESELQNWSNSERAIVKQDFTFAYEIADEKAQKLTDLVAGDMVQVIDKHASFTKISLPDGRVGFVLNSNILPLDEWLDSRNPTAENVLASALEMMGRPYLWGGTSGKGMDCSGFTKMAFFLNGIQLPRDASQQVNVGEQIDTDTSTLQNLQAGDLLFFGRKATPEKKERISHVAIYMGGGKIIHASDRVKVESLIRGDATFVNDRLASFVRSKRMLGQERKNGVIRIADSPYYQPAKDLRD